MRVLSVRFKSSTPLEDLEAPWLEVALQIAAVPGLLSKTWIQDGDLSHQCFISLLSHGSSPY